MNGRKKYLAIVLVILAGILGVWFSARDPVSSGDRTGTTSIGEPLPGLQITTLDGGELATNDLRGKLVGVNAFASWCGPCRAETPDLVRFYQENRDKVVLVGLNIGESESAILSYQQDFGVPYPLIFDPSGNVAAHFRPRGLPTTWIVDSQGIVHKIHAGPLTFERMEQITAEIQ